MPRKYTTRHKYTREQELWLCQNYKRCGYRGVSAAFLERFGVEVDHKNLCSKYSRLCRDESFAPLIQDVPDGYYTVAEVAAIWEVHQDTVRKKISLGQLAAKKFNGMRYIHQDQFEIMDRQYQKARAPLPWPAISVTEAAKMTGYDPEGLRHAMYKGYLDWRKRLGRGLTGVCSYIRKTDVDLLIQFMRERQISEMKYCKPGHAGGFSRWPEFAEYKRAWYAARGEAAA